MNPSFISPKSKKVVTQVPGKELYLLVNTRHENPVLEAMYEDFKLAKSKVTWLLNNRKECEKFDINVDRLIEKFSA